jgi:hypothetical protein
MNSWALKGSARRWTLNSVIAIAAFLIFGVTFRAGIDRGMDQLITWEGYGRVLNAIAAVITEQQFHQGGYALSNCIHNELGRRGITADPEIAKRFGMTVPQNLRANFLDKVIEDVRRDLPNLSHNCDGTIRGLGADDLGYVDFAKLAFSLFGFQIRAFYYLFFLLYGLTLLAALIERHRDPMGQIVLLSVAGLIYVSCYYSDFLLLPEPSGSGNMLNPRFMPVLAFVPGVHLLLMLVDKASPNWWRVAIAIFQSGVILFTIHIRASAVWWAPTLILALCVLFLLSLRDVGGRRQRLRLAAYRGLAVQWPAWIALIVIFVGLKVLAWSLHPVYRAGGWLQYHAMWHSIYYSLQFHPKYVEKYGAYHRGKGGDEMPFEAALIYLKNHPEEDSPDIYLAGKSLKYSAMERLDRLAFFEFVRRDPRFVFETFFIVKGQLIWNTIVDATGIEWSRAPWKARFLFILTIILLAGMAAQRPAELQRLSRFTAVVSIGAVASLSIPMLTVVFPQTMSEEIMAIQLAVTLLLCLAVAYLARAAAAWYRLGRFQPTMVARHAE